MQFFRQILRQKVIGQASFASQTMLVLRAINVEALLTFQSLRNEPHPEAALTSARAIYVPDRTAWGFLHMAATLHR